MLIKVGLAIHFIPEIDHMMQWMVLQQTGEQMENTITPWCVGDTSMIDPLLGKQHHLSPIY